MTAPICVGEPDDFTSDCLAARDVIRGWFRDARLEVAAWEPAPYPLEEQP